MFRQVGTVTGLGFMRLASRLEVTSDVVQI